MEHSVDARPTHTVIPSERSESRDLHLSDLVTTIIDGDVAVLRIDSPPVNALDAAVREALSEALQRVDARAVVIACAGRTFVAGADIGELEQAAWGDGIGPDIHPLLAQIEDFAQPIVAAIHGTALGGGLELAMACHYRVAVESARLGLPEVTLGIIPGAEGTQRLPRLVGVEKALDMGLTGRPITAPDALNVGLIDRLVSGEDLVAAATEFAREMLDRAAPRTRERTDRLGTPEQNAPIFAAARETARKTKPHIPAAALYVDAVEAFRRDEGLVLSEVDYQLVPGLSNEVRAKLEKARPFTVGQAGRIDGMTPAALGILAAYLRREARKTSKAIA